MSKKIFLCAIANITSGTCNEDCKFCSQSVRYKADIERYRYKAIDTILAEAQSAHDNGALGFCLVTADKGLTPKSLDFVCEVATAVKSKVPKLHLIACNGTATREDLVTLKRHGIDAYNHNLETSQNFYPSICTTHSWQERYDTCAQVAQADLNLISGGIFGLGETHQDRLDMLDALHSLNPISVPINFYHHNVALPLSPNPLSIEEALGLITLTRQRIPNAQRIMVAGGRELMFGSRQGEIFAAGANSIVVGNYLTTQGQAAHADLALLKSLGLDVAQSRNDR
ncbi:MAG: biotin synthase [Sulfuricurvum sp. PC08-66]|nr:MAG: biotin synthase [Sulfuricurvum sp. PC08-66]